MLEDNTNYRMSRERLRNKYTPEYIDFVKNKLLIEHIHAESFQEGYQAACEEQYYEKNKKEEINS